jgi:hypothetical protein
VPSYPKPEVFLDRDKALAQEYAERAADRIRGKYKVTPLPRRRVSAVKTTTHLVIGDSHAHPDDLNYRFEWLGRAIRDIGPDTVIDLGDSADMPSLFGYDLGSKGPLYEGHRYWQDVDCYVDAKERIALMARFGQGMKRPRLVKTEGNHEYRIERVLLDEPRLRGVIGAHNLMDVEMGWERYEYKVPIEIDGILYCHAYSNPASGREIAGVMPARLMIMNLPGSACRVQGHSHIFQLYEAADLTIDKEGRKITGIHAGCYFDPQSNAHRWAGYSVNRWRSGLLVLHVNKAQILDFQWLSYAQVEARYGKQ